MASAWGSSWGSAWGNSWGSIEAAAEAAAEVGGGGGKRRKRHVPEFVEYEEREKAPDISEFIELPAKVKKAVRKVLDKAPPDDGVAVRMLRNELSRLRLAYRPEYTKAVLRPPADLEIERRRMLEDEEDIETILLFM